MKEEPRVATDLWRDVQHLGSEGRRVTTTPETTLHSSTGRSRKWDRDECRRICGSAQSPYPHQMRPKTAPATGQNKLSISSYFGKEFSLILPPGINPREILQHITKGDMHKNASQYCSQYAKPGATAQGPIHWKGGYYTAKKKAWYSARWMTQQYNSKWKRPQKITDSMKHFYKIENFKRKTWIQDLV